MNQSRRGRFQPAPPLKKYVKVSTLISNFFLFSLLTVSSKTAAIEMNIKKDFLVYFDSEGVLNELKIVGKHFKNEIKPFLRDGIFKPPFRFVLAIDLLRIQEISHKLFQLFVWEPKKCVEIAEELSYHALRELINLTNIDISDIQIVVQITSFPGVLSSHIFQEPTQGLRIINGILMGRTALQKYTRSKVYFCSHSECPNIQGKRYRPPFPSFCGICSCRMIEDVRSSDVGEEIIGHVISPNAFQENGRFQSIRVVLRDEICNSVNLQLGVEYNFIVNNDGNDLIVWHVTCKPARFDILANLGNLQNLPIPDSIADLYYQTNAHCQDSPWAFFGGVAAILGADVLPVSSFLQLKMGLLLSLASQNSDGAPVPLAAVGADAAAVQKLIKSAGRLAERFINSSAGFVQLGGDKRRNIRDEVWYEAGAMILSRNGICNLGDWSRFRKDQCNIICQAIESGNVLLSNNDRSKTDTDFVPLKCGVWTYWCHITQSQQDQLQLRTLINVFGVPFLADESKDLEAVRLSRKILMASMNKDEEGERDPNISIEDFREFISLINSRRLTLTETAYKLIHDFFVIIRKERQECLPVGAIKTITSLAEAHARLSLRNSITYEDVMAVLYLYNESISTLSGCPFIKSTSADYDDSEPICRFENVPHPHLSINFESAHLVEPSSRLWQTLLDAFDDIESNHSEKNSTKRPIFHLVCHEIGRFQLFPIETIANGNWERNLNKRL